MIAMALMPDASYCEALSRLAGLLADIPFTRDWHVPTEKVITGWRLPVPPSLTEALFWQAAGPLASDEGPSAVMVAGARCRRGRRDAGESRGHAGEPGVLRHDRHRGRVLPVPAAEGGRADRPGRARDAGGDPGPGRNRGADPAGIRLVKRGPSCSPGASSASTGSSGHDLITAILDAGGHVIARVSAGIALPVEDGPGSGWLPEGSRTTWLNAPSGRKSERLPVRACERNTVFPAGNGKGEEVSETCTIITTLLDRETAPAQALREPCRARWSSCETTFGEDKATIAGAGNRTSGPVLRSGPSPAGHPGGLGLAHRHPADQGLGGRRPGQRVRRRPRAPCASC